MRIHNTIDQLDAQIFKTANGDLTISQLKDLMKKSFKYGCNLQPDEAEKETLIIIDLYLDYLGLEHSEENRDKAWDEKVSKSQDDYLEFLREADYRSAPLANAAIKACEFFELIGYGK